jgi:hypothetical protein
MARRAAPLVNFIRAHKTYIFAPPAARYSGGMTHRIIYRLCFWLERLPTDAPESSTALYVELNQEGNSCRGRNGRPRHKRRVIDLRVGDDIMVNGRWRTIKEIEPQSEGWMTDDVAAARTDTYGYCYRLKDETRTPEEIRSEKSRLDVAKRFSPQPHDQPQPYGNERRGD